MLFSEPEHSHSRQVFYCRYWVPKQILLCLQTAKSVCNASAPSHMYISLFHDSFRAGCVEGKQEFHDRDDF